MKTGLSAGSLYVSALLLRLSPSADNTRARKRQTGHNYLFANKQEATYNHFDIYLTQESKQRSEKHAGQERDEQ